MAENKVRQRGGGRGKERRRGGEEEREDTSSVCVYSRGKGLKEKITM